MGQRANVFVVHSWDDADACRRMEGRLRKSDPDLAHYTLTPERALPGRREEVLRGIRNRIKTANAVVVLNTPGLHKRESSRFEMQTAVRMKKRIVLVQPHGNFQLPVPAELKGNVYRHATSRSDVIGRAIRGEYPQDGRVFDVAEVADRRSLASILSAGVAAVSFIVIARDLTVLKRDLASRGIKLVFEGEEMQEVAAHAAVGALIGCLIGALSGDGKTALATTLAGASVGAAVGFRRVYKARLLGNGPLKVLTVEPS